MSSTIYQTEQARKRHASEYVKDSVPMAEHLRLRDSMQEDIDGVERRAAQNCIKFLEMRDELKLVKFKFSELCSDNAQINRDIDAVAAERDEIIKEERAHSLQFCKKIDALNEEVGVLRTELAVARAAATADTKLANERQHAQNLQIAVDTEVGRLRQLVIERNIELTRITAKLECERMSDVTEVAERAALRSELETTKAARDSAVACSDHLNGRLLKAYEALKFGA
jgi:hypothetical protein